MALEIIKRILSYNGSMEYKPLNDEMIISNYQHYFVVEHYKENIENKKVLDAGCWTGPLEKVIAQKEINTELVGLDENEEALSVAQRNFPQFKFVQGRLTEKDSEILEKYKGYFDTIIFLDVLEHIPKGTEEQILSLFNQLLKPDGVLIVSTMSSHIFNFIDPAWFFGHRHYSVKAMKKMLANSGFQFREFKKIGNLYWDIDILMLYIYKYIFKKEYKTSSRMHTKIDKGFQDPFIPTRFYVKSNKIN